MEYLGALLKFARDNVGVITVAAAMFAAVLYPILKPAAATTASTPDHLERRLLELEKKQNELIVKVAVLQGLMEARQTDVKDLIQQLFLNLKNSP